MMYFDTLCSRVELSKSAHFEISTQRDSNRIVLRRSAPSPIAWLAVMRCASSRDGASPIGATRELREQRSVLAFHPEPAHRASRLGLYCTVCEGGKSAMAGVFGAAAPFLCCLLLAAAPGRADPVARTETGSSFIEKVWRFRGGSDFAVFQMLNPAFERPRQSICCVRVHLSRAEHRSGQIPFRCGTQSDGLSRCCELCALIGP